MTHRMMARIAVSFLILASILVGASLGGLDKSGSTVEENLTLSDFGAMIPQTSGSDFAAGVGAPQAAATAPGTEVAAYTQQAPSGSQIGALMPSTILSSPPRYMFYSGNYLSWNDFSATFPTNRPCLWIERAVSWSMYATLPWGGWARELMYVPTASPVTMYEVYPGGYVQGYNLGFAQPGYYYIWYYADTPGRHRSVISTNSGYSNEVVVDVYSTSSISTYIKPNPPSPKEQCERNPLCTYWNGHCYCTGLIDDPAKRECEKNPLCSYVNGHCYCTGLIDDPAKQECEKNPLCSYVNGHCYCTGLIDDPAKQECESNPQCDYVNGHCYCRGLDPDDPEKANCEQNPQCSWSNGQCYCRGLNPDDPEKANCEQNPQCSWSNGQCYCRGLDPQPDPNPEPTPNPNPEPFNPAPNPVAECEQNPSCHWSNGQCLCTGLGSGGSDSTDYGSQSFGEYSNDN